MKKRILFIRTFAPFNSGGPVAPLGILYLAGAVEKHLPEWEIGFLDTGKEHLNRDNLTQRIREFDPDVVGLSTLTCEAPLMEEIASLVKSLNPKIQVVLGGPHVNSLKEKALTSRNIDVVVFHEGEEIIVELLKAFEQQRSDLSTIVGIAFWQGELPFSTGIREKIQNLDDLPTPKWDLCDFSFYSKQKSWNGITRYPLIAPLMTSRGCPYQCTFCHHSFGLTVRVRAPESIVAEMRHLYDTYGVREFHVVDDIFNVQPKRAIKVCQLIVDSGMKVALSFPNGLRADIMTDELLEWLVKAGTYKINYGFETVTPRLQKVLRKGVNVKKAQDIFAKTSDSGIITGAYFMLGIPTETEEEMNNTVAYAIDSKLDNAGFFKPTAYPGTQLYEEMGFTETSEARSTGKSDQDFESMHFFATGGSISTVSDEVLDRAIVEAHQKFFFQPQRIWRHLKKSPKKGRFLVELIGAIIVSIQARLFGFIRDQVRA